MGAQSVASQGGGVSTVQMHKSESLARQGSLYSLTLDEVQTQLGDLGKPLSSMNLDELLKTVWTAEATQAPDNNNNNNDVISGSASGLHKQGSLTFSRDLSKKTVDEVWKDIQHKNNKYSDQERNKVQEKNPTLGEITLEDFLVKAGVVTESYNSNNNNNNSEKGNAAAGVLGVDSIAAPQHSHWMQMQFQLPSVQQQQQNMMVLMHHPVPVQVQQQPLPVMDAPYSDTHMTMSPTSLIGTLSDTQTPGRKRGATGEVVEKTVERRQKRMIKNRESAARSRARKQAYTHELENKVSRLEEENERLRRKKEEEKVLPSAPPPEPKYQLRRTSSAPI